MYLIFPPTAQPPAAHRRAVRRPVRRHGAAGPARGAERGETQHGEGEGAEEAPLPGQRQHCAAVPPREAGGWRVGAYMCGGFFSQLSNVFSIT